LGVGFYSEVGLLTCRLSLFHSTVHMTKSVSFLGSIDLPYDDFLTVYVDEYFTFEVRIGDLNSQPNNDVLNISENPLCFNVFLFDKRSSRSEFDHSISSKRLWFSTELFNSLNLSIHRFTFNSKIASSLWSSLFNNCYVGVKCTVARLGPLDSSETALLEFRVSAFHLKRASYNRVKALYFSPYTQTRYPETADVLHLKIEQFLLWTNLTVQLSTPKLFAVIFDPECSKMYEKLFSNLLKVCLN